MPRPRAEFGVARRALAALAGVLSAAAAQARDVPAELQPFVEKGTRALAIESADLNRDGTPDFVVVLEKVDAKGEPVEIDEGQRPLLVILRGADGGLKLAKRNDRVVLCSHCGGMMGDPFAGIEAKAGSITVTHYGGSAWRWATEHRFDYSRIDATWQLVRATETSFHAMDEAKKKEKVYRPPKDYGKIDLADFDPENYRKKK